jgi:3',5'-cyclic AMP phosphodiesterase CpdA
MKKALMLMILALASCSVVVSPLSNDVIMALQFHPDGTFKVAQFTDLHLDITSETTGMTLEVIEHVLKTENPDIAIFTGDIVNKTLTREGWVMLTEFLGNIDVKWTIVLGNHDDEGDMSREDIFEFLENKTGFIGVPGPDISGVGNFILPVVSSGSDSVKALLYLFDSHGYPPEDKPGSYDWIKFDQIKWYRKRSHEFTRGNNDKPVPALCFLHIPFPEFMDAYGIETTVGTREEDVYAPVLNSGLFTSMVEMGDVMGVFAGHDHVNNYIGIVHKIALGYGQITGLNAYGDFERGARIIELHEGQHSFNTWIRTITGDSLHYNYPSGKAFD